MDKKIITRSLANATGLLAYVAFAALVMNNAQKIFGKGDSALNGIVFLLFFVFSASISSSLVLGKPILMYMEGQKKEGVKMLVHTIIWIFVFFVIFGTIRFVTKS